MKTINNNILNKFLYSAFSVIIIALFALSCSEEKPTEEMFAPTLFNNGATNIARTSVTLKGSITGNTGAITEYGFKCSTSEAFPSDQTITKNVEGNSFSSITASIDGLEPNTHYYYCIYASTGASDLQANAGEFTTLATVSPTFGEMRIDSIGENVIKVSCNVNEIGDNVLMEYGISYRTEASETFIPIAAKEFNDAATMDYTVEITGLQAETKYIVRPYAKNSSTESGENGVLEGYGTTQTITTESLLSPQVTTDQMGTPGINSITISGIVNEATGSNGKIDEVGFCWSTTTSEPTIMEDHVVVEGHTELKKQFTTTIDNLLANTQYYIRAYAKNTVDDKARYGYGEVKTFKTSDLQTPQLSINESSATATSISITATISNYDAGALVEKGFIWSTSDAQVTLDNAGSNIVKVTNGENVFTSSVQGLSMNTRYYFRAYAIYEASGIQQIGYSSYSTITTNDFNSVSFDNLVIKDITCISANIEAAIIDVGNGKLIEKGFVWSTDVIDPSLDNNESHKIIIEGEQFSTTIEGLAPNTGYNVKAYAITQIEGQTKTSYSGRYSFGTSWLTFADIKFSDDWTNSTAFSMGFTGTILTEGDGPTAEMGVLWEKWDGIWDSLRPEDCEGKVAFTKQADGSYAGAIPNMPGRELHYEYYSKIVLNGKEYYNYHGSSIRGTDQMTVESFTYSNTATSISLSCIAKDLEKLSQYKEAGFVYIKYKEGEEINWDKATKVACTPDGNNKIATTIENLNSGDTYALNVYITTELGTAYDDSLWTATLLRTPSEDDNNSPDISEN